MSGMAPYDSREETLKHINRVRHFLDIVAAGLTERGAVHDASKLESREKPVFDRMTPKLRHCTYGSEEYFGFLAEMKVALDHHYENNRHHPEFHKDGVEGMNLIDLVEMLCDWKAASERHADGNIVESIEVNAKRFMLSPQLTQIFLNTVRDMGWDVSETPKPEKRPATVKPKARKPSRGL